MDVEIPRIKGSRFLAWLAPAATESEALEVVERVRAAHPSATHWVFAWRLTAGQVRSTDDGEPAGTAGRPLLDRLVGHDLEGVVLVVVRYYGGTKLGTGGLVRAYGAAAAAAIEACEVVEVARRTTVFVTVGPKLEGPVRGVALQHGAEVIDVQWGVEARMELAVEDEAVEGFERAVQERCAGTARIERVTAG
ncbi:MAG: YigZ family protein [Myxococcota bacterium]